MYCVLLSIAGIATKTAVRLIAEIEDIRRLYNNRQLNAFVGIDIHRYQSNKVIAKDKIKKRGNKHLRKSLFSIIQNMIKRRPFGQNHFRNYYGKIKKPYNKCHKVAWVACMNKLLKTIFFLITHNMNYEYRLYQHFTIRTHLVKKYVLTRFI